MAVRARRRRNLPRGVVRGPGGRFISTRRNKRGVPFSSPAGVYRPRIKISRRGPKGRFTKRTRFVPSRRAAATLGLRRNPARRRRRNLPRRGSSGRFLTRRNPARRRRRNPRRGRFLTRRNPARRRRRNPDGLLGQVKSIFTVDTLQTAGLGVAGFVAVPLITTSLAAVVGKPQWAEDWTGVVLTGLSAGLVGGAAKAFLGGMGNKILAGAVVAFGVRLVSELAPVFMGSTVDAASGKPAGPGIAPDPELAARVRAAAAAKIGGIMEQVSVDALSRSTLQGLGNDVQLSPYVGYFMETADVLPSDVDVDALARSAEVNQVA